MKKAQTFASEMIAFEPEEVVEMKTFGTSGLTLMGFKSRDAIKKYFHIKPAQFLYPDEKASIVTHTFSESLLTLLKNFECLIFWIQSVEGSTTLFSGLLKRCLDRDVIAICRYIPRKNTPPRFVALVPQVDFSSRSYTAALTLVRMVFLTC